MGPERAVLLGIAVFWCLAVGKAQILNEIDIGALPQRNITITGASFAATDAYIDVTSLLGVKKNPLDDRAFLESPQMSLLCTSLWVSPSTFSLFAHMPLVDMPLAWYYPLNYAMETWSYKYGDTLKCELWECDGGPGGCDPAKPQIRPNATAGDDLLGRGMIDLWAFQLLGTAVLNMTVPAGAKGVEGAEAGQVLLSCPGCRALLRDNPLWRTPFTFSGSIFDELLGAFQGPSAAPQPEASPSPAPATPLPEISLAPEIELPPVPDLPQITIPELLPLPIPQQEQQQVSTLNPFIPLPEPVLAPSPLVYPSPALQPPAGEGKLPPNNPADGTRSVPVVEDTPTSDTNVLIVVLAVTGSSVAAVAVGLITFCVCSRRRRAVRPDAAVMPPTRRSEKTPAGKSGGGPPLRVRVANPGDADAAIRHARGEAAIAEIPKSWAPKNGV